jgi:serine/threonine protein kinase
MPFSILCPQCKKQFVVENIGTGETACPHCRQFLRLKSSEPPAAPTLQLFANRYELRGEPLGEGTFGVVYRAYDQEMKREVALKKLKIEQFEADPLQSSEVIVRFMRESDVLANVTHPNVIPILHRGAFQKTYYIVFPLIRGRRVTDIIPKDGFEDPRRAVWLAIKLLRALHYVFSKHKILHRDVKPANMMVVDGDEDALYLMDFGLAALHDMDQTRITRAGLGTPAYMSPEQLQAPAMRIGHPSDLYSAAAVLYHLLTGKVVFPDVKSIWELQYQIVNTPPDPPSRRRPGLEALDHIVLKGLAKRPSERYQTGLEFESALKEWLDTRSAYYKVSTDRPKEKAKPASTPRAKSSSPASTAVDSKAVPRRAAVAAVPAAQMESVPSTGESTAAPMALPPKPVSPQPVMPRPEPAVLPASAQPQVRSVGSQPLPPPGKLAFVLLVVFAMVWLVAAVLWGGWAYQTFFRRVGEVYKFGPGPPTDSTPKVWICVTGVALLVALVAWTIFAARHYFRSRGVYRH